MQKLISFIIAIIVCQLSFAQSLKVVHLKCEGKENAFGIDVPQPTFSWQLESTKRGVEQTAYSVTIIPVVPKTSSAFNIWTSGKVKSAKSNLIQYIGKPLAASTLYNIYLVVWDNKGVFSQAKSSFFTGLMGAKDWDNAQWIGYEEMPDTSRIVPGIHNPDAKRKLGEKAKQRDVVPMFRKEFTAEKQVVKAVAFVSGLGHYEMSINGNKVSNSFLAPGWTHYDARVLYNSYDVTDFVKQGKNAVGAIVGNGFYNISRERYYKTTIAYGYPKFLCKILVQYSDGTSSVIVSDASWKTTQSPITFSSIYGGEDYDATKEESGWDKSGFADNKWKNVVLVKQPQGKLEAERDYPVEVKETFEVKKISKPKDSSYVYDFGQNMSGIIELKVQGKKGQIIKLRPAELLFDNGTANQNATGKQYYFSYTLKGDGVEIWRPRFTYYGFRYVQVDGQAADTTMEGFPKIIQLQALHTRNAAPEAGSFVCSNDLFNRIDTLIKWSIKSNYQSVLTDCPHREKFSWLEQDYLMGSAIKSNYTIEGIFRKLVYDMMDAQTAEGLIPDVAPEYVFFDDHGFGFRDSPEWGSASVILPWMLYKWYGDSAIIRTAYPMMKKYVDYLTSKSKNNILNYGLGDWYDNGPQRPGVSQLTPKALTATSTWYYDLNLLAQMGTMLRKKADVIQYQELAAKVKQAFTDSFFNAKTKVYATGSQTSMSMPLCVGLVEEGNKAAVMKNLVDSIHANGKQLTAGDVGYHYLVEALQNGGQSQLLYEMNYRDDVPGYGFQLKKGATALTESWAALKEVSNNHLMLGHIMDWFYNGLAGINQADTSDGFKHLIIKPEIVGNISYVKASYETIYGIVKVEWHKDVKRKDRFNLLVAVPANSTATVYIPVKDANHLSESGKSLKGRKDIKIISKKDDRVIVEIGSGEYHFVERQG